MSMRYCFQKESRNSTSRPRYDILYPFDFFIVGCEIHAQGFHFVVYRTGMLVGRGQKRRAMSQQIIGGVV